MTARRSTSSVRWMLALLILALCATMVQAADDTWTSPPATAGAPIVLKIAIAEDQDGNPAAAGKAAAEALKKAMGDAPLRAVIVSECFEDQENKARLLEGITSVLPKEIIVGAATYGSFTQAGCTDADSVCLLGLGGQGLSVAAGLVTGMGAAKLTFEKDRELIASRLRAAGEQLAQKLRKTDQDRLLVLLADAHSPKNQSLVEGVQKVLGPQFPITGGCANKNAGQTFVYFRGRMVDDSAVAVMLSGDFKLTLAGRKAKDNDLVISTANDGAKEAFSRFQGQALGVLAFNCAGRRSKLKNMADELAAIQKAIGSQMPLFGCYCAGEIGPVDQSEKTGDALSGGTGWHVMFTVLGR